MKDFGQLKNKLDSQFQVFFDLLQIEHQKSQVIMEGNALELDKLVNLEQSLLMRSSNLEAERQQILKELGLEDMTISQLIRDYPQAEDADLPQAGKELQDTLMELRKANGLNQRLLKARLDVIDHVLSETGIKPADSATYNSKSGRVEKKKEWNFGNTLLNKKV